MVDKDAQHRDVLFVLFSPISALVICDSAQCNFKFKPGAYVKRQRWDYPPDVFQVMYYRHLEMKQPPPLCDGVNYASIPRAFTSENR